MPPDADACIANLESGEIVPENSLKLLCQHVSELLMEESNAQPVLSPVACWKHNAITEHYSAIQSLAKWVVMNVTILCRTHPHLRGGNKE